MMLDKIYASCQDDLFNIKAGSGHGFTSEQSLGAGMALSVFLLLLCPDTASHTVLV